jgi:hypothetical protein
MGAKGRMITVAHSHDHGFQSVNTSPMPFTAEGMFSHEVLVKHR